MNPRLSLAAVLLSLATLPAQGGAVSARMEVRFVVQAACTVAAAGSGMPSVACSDASPYRVVAAAAAPAPGAAGWTVTF